MTEEASWIEHPSTETLSTVLVHTPLDKDMHVLEELLASDHARTLRSINAESLDQLLQGTVDALIVSQEGMTKKALGVFEKHLNTQPSWSELPIILLVDSDLHVPNLISQLRGWLPRSKLIILQRPVRRTEFTTVLQSVLAGRRHQYSVRDHLSYQEELRRELNHRIKNIFATVQALFEMSRRGADDIEALTQDYRGRLHALTAVHTRLYERSDKTIEVKTLINDVKGPFAVNEQIRATGPDVLISGELAETAALAFHELVTNALKYGALSLPEGYVTIAWARQEDDAQMLDIDWVESDGPKVKTPEKRGYGTRFIESALTSQGGSVSLDFASDGLRAKLSLPLIKDHNT